MTEVVRLGSNFQSREGVERQLAEGVFDAQGADFIVDKILEDGVAGLERDDNGSLALVVLPRYETDETGKTSGYLRLRVPGADETVDELGQPREARVLYTSTGEGDLVGVEFLDPDSIDLTRLSDFEGLPSDGELVLLFNGYGITPEVSRDLVE